jgi:hypothetical protein
MKRSWRKPIYRAKKTERARAETDIVVDCLWYANNGKRVTVLMNTINKRRRDLHGLDSAFRIEPAVPAAKTDHFSYAIAIVQFEKERPNYVVEPWA